MAVDKPSFLITECYSPRNLGDGELVAATIDRVSSLGLNSEISLVALDVEQFRAQYPAAYVYARIFDRRLYSRSASHERLFIVFLWASFIALQSLIVVIVPPRMRKVVSRFFLGACTNSMRKTATAYVHCEGVFAVGGGYIGDRYIRESVLTAWTWWWVERLGSRVVTMPISIEARGWLLRTVLRIFLRNVNLTARDAASVKVLAELELPSKYVPDLAFRNVGTEVVCEQLVAQRSKGRTLLIVPVGGDYFAEEVWKDRLREVADLVNSAYDDWHVRLFSMHLSLDGADAGRDAEAVSYLRKLIPRSSVWSCRDVGSYGDLCSKISGEVDLVLSARMHAGIAALCVGTPLVMLGYEEKHRTLMDSLNLTDQYINFEHLNVDNVALCASSALSKSRTLLRGIADSQARLLKDWKVW